MRDKSHFPIIFYTIFKTLKKQKKNYPLPPFAMIWLSDVARGQTHLPWAGFGQHISMVLLTDHCKWGGGGNLSRMIIPMIVWKSEKKSFWRSSNFNVLYPILMHKTYFNAPLTLLNNIYVRFYPRLWPIHTVLESN